MRAVAALFILLQALAAIALFASSVHGPSGLGVAAPLYLATAAALTAFAAFRAKSMALPIACGVTMLAAAPGLFVLLDRLDGVVYQRRIAATQVSDVRDELIYSAGGAPIGVRLSFAVRVPSAGYFGISPSLDAPGPETERLSLVPLRSTMDGAERGAKFEADRRHQLMFELYPPILSIRPQGERCLTPVAVPPLAQASTPKPIRVTIYETSYGLPWRGGTEQFTRGAYDLVAIYRGVLAEGLPACKVVQ